MACPTKDLWLLVQIRTIENNSILQKKAEDTEHLPKTWYVRVSATNSTLSWKHAKKYTSTQDEAQLETDKSKNIPVSTYLDRSIGSTECSCQLRAKTAGKQSNVSILAFVRCQQSITFSPRSFVRETQNRRLQAGQPYIL